jgi:hypothetical protein
MVDRGQNGSRIASMSISTVGARSREVEMVEMVGVERW